jgi:hypothetical protein
MFKYQDRGFDNQAEDKRKDMRLKPIEIASAINKGHGVRRESIMLWRPECNAFHVEKTAKLNVTYARDSCVLETECRIGLEIAEAKCN